MRSTTYILGVATFLLSGVALAQDVYCPTVPKPAGVACGVLKEPRDPFHVTTYRLGLSDDECVTLCLGSRRCASFTYEPSQGACATYKRNSTNMAMQHSEDGSTRFYNRKCYFKQQQFRAKLSNPDSPSVFDGQYIFSTFDQPGDDAHLNPTRFTPIARSDGDLFQIQCDGTLVNTDLGYSGYRAYDSSDPDADFATLYFLDPSVAQGVPDDKPVLCSINKATKELSCSTEAGNVFYACNHNNDPTDYRYGLSIASLENPPPSTTSCQVVNLFVRYL